MIETYYMRVDIGRNGFATNFNIGDISSRLIGTMTWNVGMDSADQSFASPARLTCTLDNIDGAFNPDTLGAELLTNGDFATWSGDNPSSWTVTGEVGADPAVSECGADELQGGSGTGAANFYSTSGDITISQLSLPIRTSYQVTMEISAAADNAGYLAVYYDAVQISPYYHFTGIYTFYFNTDNVASGALKITATGPVNMTVNSISLKQTSLYGKLLNVGMLCSLQIVTPAFVAYPQYVGRLADISLNPGSVGRRTVTLTFNDPMYDLMDTEYSPPLYTDVTADVPIKAIFDAPIVPFPYAHSYWMLGTQGSSELDLTTTLYSPPTYSFDTGISSFEWVGDNSMDNDKQTTSAQTFIRDLVEGEINGRFFYDPYLTGYVFHNRQRDALNASVQYTLTEDDFEAPESTFAKADIVNRATITYQPRESGNVGTVLWSGNGQEMGVNVKKTIRYRDLDNPEARVGASVVIPPLAQTDYIVVDAVDGTDVTNYITVTVEAGANSAELTLTNGWTKSVRFSLLQVRGTPLKTFQPSSVTSDNPDSQRNYKVASDRRNYRLIDNDIDAKAVADFIVYKHADPLAVYERVTFNKDKTDSRFTNGANSTVGQRITITDTFLGHSADYFVVGYKHNVIFGGDGIHNVTQILKPAAKENYWILDTSALGTSTRLGL